MKINEKESSLVKSNLNDSAKFSIGNLGQVILILRDKMYSNPKNTLVQEYLSNARDANREVNSSRPPEVYLPNEFSPILKIRDFGPGLSYENAKNIFIQYATSTKTSNNKLTGGFGLGSKSYFAYGDAFTIHSYLEGVKTTYLAHISQDPSGLLDIINSIPTDEPNGLEIELPVRKEDIENFKTSFYRTTFMWGNERPIVKGIIEDEIPSWWKNPEIMNWEHNPNLLFEGERFKFCHFPSDFKSDIKKSYGYNFVYIFVDGIPYKPLESSYIKNTLLKYFPIGKPKETGICVFVKTGELEIPANREEILNTPKNIEFLNKLADNILLDFRSQLNQKINSIPNSKILGSILKLNETVRGLDDSIQVENLSIHIESIKSFYPKVKITHPEIIHSIKKISRSSKAKKFLLDEVINTLEFSNSGSESCLFFINDLNLDHEKVFHKLSTSSKITLNKNSTKQLVVLEDNEYTREFFTNNHTLISSLFEKKVKDQLTPVVKVPDNSIIYYGLIPSKTRHYNLNKVSKSIDKNKIKTLEKTIVFTLGKNNSFNPSDELLEKSKLLITLGFNLVGVSEKNKSLFSDLPLYENIQNDLAKHLNLKNEDTLKDLKILLLKKTTWYNNIFSELSSTLLSYLNHPVLQEIIELKQSPLKYGSTMLNLYSEEEKKII